MINLFGSDVGEEELEELSDCFSEQWLGIGPKTAEFEREFGKKIGNENFLFLNSGSNSLQMAVKLLDLPPGAEVIVPAYTWIACANAVVLNRLKPVFCDVDLDTCNVRAEDIEKKIGPATRAIMVVHYAGKPVDIDSLRQFKLPIIEDAAHAVDSFYKGKHCGNLGDVGIFSFDAVKNLTTGEGGGLVTQSPELFQHAKNLRYCGIAKSGYEASAVKKRWWEYQVNDPFPKMLNSDLAAAIGVVQLRRLRALQEKRKGLWDQFSERIENQSWARSWLIRPPGPVKDETHSYFTYFVRLKFGSRDQLAEYLFGQGIYTSLRYHPLHHYPVYGTRDSLPNCDELNDTALNLPLHPRLSSSDLDKIFSVLETFRKDKT